MELKIIVTIEVDDSDPAAFADISNRLRGLNIVDMKRGEADFVASMKETINDVMTRSGRWKD